MKRIGMPLLIGLMLWVACSEKQFPRPGSTIGADSIQRLSSQRKIQWIDVRTEEEYREGHIPGAIQMDVLQEARFLEQIKQLNPRESFVLYCRSGRRSKKAMELMQQKGFKKVIDLEGGILAWKGPIEKP